MKPSPTMTKARNRTPRLMTMPLLALLVLALVGAPPASADTGITVYQPQVVELAGFGIAVTATITATAVGPGECPDGADLCEGRHTRIATYQAPLGRFAPIALGAGPNPVTKSATVGSECLNNTRFRGEFFQQMVWIIEQNPLPPARITQDDLRWGTERFVDSCLDDVTPPIP